jgi:hypothetical protein
MKMTNTQLKMTDVLRILAGCAGEGATHDALLRSSGCTGKDLGNLVRQGFARQRTAAMANPPGLVVTRYWITDAGLEESRRRQAEKPNPAAANGAS